MSIMNARLLKTTKVKLRAILIDPRAYDWFADFIEGFVPHLEHLDEDTFALLLPMTRSARKIRPLLDLIDAWAALPESQRKIVARSLREDLSLPNLNVSATPADP